MKDNEKARRLTDRIWPRALASSPKSSLPAGLQIRSGRYPKCKPPLLKD